MLVYSFQSRKSGDIYGFTTDKTGANLPANFAPWIKHGQQQMNPGDSPRIGVHTDDVLNGIQRDGFFLAGVKITVTTIPGVQPPKKP